LLNNVVYIHEEFSLTKNYQPSEEYIYEYILEYDNGEEYVDLGFPRIDDPNTKEICAAGANTIGNPHTIFLIENGTTYFDTGTEEFEDVCIRQLPYTLNLGRIEVGEKEVEEDHSYEGDIEDEGESLDTGEEGDIVEGNVGEEISKTEEIGEVLGINILPKTVIQSYGYLVLGIFLVALGILCYYLTNENTIHNA